VIGFIRVKQVRELLCMKYGLKEKNKKKKIKRKKL
jgi:hypothetical protein